MSSTASTAAPATASFGTTSTPATSSFGFGSAAAPSSFAVDAPVTHRFSTTLARIVLNIRRKEHTLKRNRDVEAEHMANIEATLRDDTQLRKKLTENEETRKRLSAARIAVQSTIKMNEEILQILQNDSDAEVIKRETVKRSNGTSVVMITLTK